MRFIRFFFLLSGPVFAALTNNDLVGMWKAEGLDGPGSISEIWYGADLNRELRSSTVYEDIGDYVLNVDGTWSVSGDNVLEKTAGGWVSFGGDVDPVQPDNTANSTKVELVAGAPKKIKLTECDNSVCHTSEYTYVGADKHFSVIDLGASTFVRRVSARPVRIFGSGRFGARFLFQGRAFDLRGRLLGQNPLR